MPREQVQAFYAHVWPIFWPVLWWNLIVYRAWRAELRERGYDGNICIAVAKWGRLVVTYVEPPRPDVPAYQGLSQRCTAHIARLSTSLTGNGAISGDTGPGWLRLSNLPLPSLRGSVIYPVPFLDSS